MFLDAPSMDLQKFLCYDALMDDWNQNQGYSEYNEYNPNHRNSAPMPTRNGSFENAALILGIVGLFSASCGMGIFLGALAIIFGLLSKGGTFSLGPKGKAGIFLGIAAIAFTLITTIASLVILILQLGGFENFLAQYRLLYDALQSGDINDVYQILYGMSGVPVQ